jgi:proteasome lid subunit RPN8/RPN11
MICGTHDIAQAIAAHAVSTYPDECVGVLLGHWDQTTTTIRAIWPLDNRWPPHQDNHTRHSRFLLSPEDYVWADQQAQQRGMEIVGCYHAHPDQAAIPSAHDLAGARHAGGGPSFVYLIQSVWRGAATDLTAWCLVDDGSYFRQQWV